MAAPPLARLWLIPNGGGGFGRGGGGGHYAYGGRGGGGNIESKTNVDHMRPRAS